MTRPRIDKLVISYLDKLLCYLHRKYGEVLQRVRYQVHPNSLYRVFGCPCYYGFDGGLIFRLRYIARWRVWRGMCLSPRITKKSRVYKGGSWADRIYWLNPSTRRYMDQDKASSKVGFRCAMSTLGNQIPNTPMVR